jgi:hypothetical protein
VQMIEITVFTKHGGPLTKRISLDASGKLKNDSSACLMTNGTAQRVATADAMALAKLIISLRPDQAIALGRLRSGLPDKVNIVTKQSLHALNGKAPPNAVTRTADNIIHAQGEPGFVLWDYDSKGMPALVRDQMTAAGGVWPALVHIMPELVNAYRVKRASTSAGLYRSDTGAQVPGSNGLHNYIGVADASDSVRFLTVLHERCWLAGFGWFIIGAGGQLLERSIIDRMVGQPERLVFEGGPILAPPLAQDAKKRRPYTHGEIWLDTLKVCPPLTVLERARLGELKAKARQALAGASAKAQEEFICRRTNELSKRTGVSKQDAQAIIKRQCRGVLLPGIVLPFDDPALAGKTVGDVLADPAAFEGETLADPLEGFSYGRGKAKIMRREDGAPWIHSFAHGRTVYELRYDADAVRAAIENAPKAAAVKAFLRMALRAELDAAEEESLVETTVKRSGTGKRSINATLKKARDEAGRDKRAAERQQRMAERNDPRPMLELPDRDAPFIPVMGALNEVLGASKESIPPGRNIEGDLVRTRLVRIPEMHVFASANEDSDTGGQAPPQMVIKVLNEANASEMIERHIDFVDAKARSVQLHSTFVSHYMNRDDGALPVIAAVATLPMVSADGHLIYTEGLDRKRGIAFNVDPTIMKIIPNRTECGPEAVAAALKFLTDDWLVDVAADYAGKCTLVALACTVIQRTLLDDRPAFFVTAGRRGGGKTTTIKMITQAITGTPAAASAWSPSEEERRKSLISYLLLGVPYILWDNIPRGLQIACPHVEKACTSSFTADRKLGESEIVQAASSTIHCFTGNNIGPKGDLASRALQVRLNVDRPDPENRLFRHQDPVGWTQANRGKILAALFTILLGNRELGLPQGAALRSRFKRWQRLVGSAVEYAAQCTAERNPDVDHVPDKIVDFATLFLSQEAEDEDSADWADCLDAISKMALGGVTASDVSFQLCNTQTDNTAIVREVLFPAAPVDCRPTPKAVAKRLKARVDDPVRHGSETLTLKAHWEAHGKIWRYWVERKK